MSPMGRGPSDRRTIEELASQLLADVGIPQPWDPEEFARRLSAKFGKPVRLLPLSAEAERQDLLDAGITGTILESDQLITIAYADDGSEMHQLNVVAHELGHRLLGHVAKGHVMCRSDFGSANERQAEQFARAVVFGARRGDPLQWSPHTDDHPGVRRLGGALADGF